jgi:hypothetical protein
MFNKSENNTLPQILTLFQYEKELLLVQDCNKFVCSYQLVSTSKDIYQKKFLEQLHILYTVLFQQCQMEKSGRTIEFFIVKTLNVCFPS